MLNYGDSGGVSVKNVFVLILLIQVSMSFGGLVITTPDGSEVILFEDGTWDYCEDLIQNNCRVCDNVNDYLRAIKLGGEWFLKNQNDIFLYYEYYPFEKRYSYDRQLVREAAAIWILGRLSKFLNDVRYEELAQRGFLDFEVNLEYDYENDFHYLSNIDSNIAHSAFLVLGLLEIEYPLKDYYLDKIAKGIVFMQNEDGSFKTTYGSSDTLTGIDYYPGEALVAMMSMYEYTGDRFYIEVVERAFNFYSDYWRENQNAAFVPWHSRAYAKLYHATGRKDVADFILEMNDYIVMNYSSYGDLTELVFTGINSAVYVEGMNQAYLIASELGDADRKKLYLNFIEKGTDYFLKLQITGTANFLSAEAVGGFMSSPTSDLQRVDNNQHALMALVDSYELGIFREIF